jgi:hypothetical protein
MKFIYFLAFCIVISFAVDAQTLKTGTTAGQVLKINVGPRAIGMGGAFTASTGDLSSLYWNPGGVAGISGSEAAFYHADLYADVKHEFAAFATNLQDFGVVGVFVNVLSMDEMKVRTIEKPEGTGELFRAGALVVGLNYAKNLTNNFSIGFNAKYINEYIWNMSAAGVAVDIGTLYRIPVLNELRIAASISNFGTKMKLAGRDVLVITPSGASDANLLNSNLELDEFDLPLVFRFGLAADVIKMDEHVLSVGVDAVHPNDHTEYINTGLEYAWNDLLFIRGGYNSLFEEESEKGLTLGFGINYKIGSFLGIKLDYAYQAFGRLTNIQYFSVGIKF